jgi:hypothetical protein
MLLLRNLAGSLSNHQINIPSGPEIFSTHDLSRDVPGSPIGPQLSLRLPIPL